MDQREVKNFGWQDPLITGFDPATIRRLTDLPPTNMTQTRIPTTPARDRNVYPSSATVQPVDTQGTAAEKATTTDRATDSASGGMSAIDGTLLGAGIFITVLTLLF